jgi:hypothetical protein
MEVRPGRAGGGEHRRGLAAPLREAEREESCAALVHMAPDADARLVPEGERQRCGSGPGRDAGVLDAATGKLLHERGAKRRIAVRAVHGAKRYSTG